MKDGVLVLDDPRGRYRVRQVLLQKSCVLERLWQECRCCVGVTATLIVAGLKIFEKTMSSTSCEAVATFGGPPTWGKVPRRKACPPPQFLLFLF